MVSVPKTNPIPKLSIVVPVHGDPAAFESTLISVLENQPSGSEVIVPHDGSYQDPFQLADEIRLVVSPSREIRDLYAIAAHHARGRFVHLLGSGLRATDGWTDAAIKAFDHFDTAAVASVIRSNEGYGIMAAGWKNSVQRLCHPSTSVPQNTGYSTKCIGAYLQASFWRRDVLRSLDSAFQGKNLAETAMVYHFLIQQAGWRPELAIDSHVICDQASLAWDTSSLRRGMRLAAIRNHFSRSSSTQTLLAGVVACATSLVKTNYLMESIGQLFSPLAEKVSPQIDPESVLACDEQGMLVPLSRRNSSVSTRRAA